MQALIHECIVDGYLLLLVKDIDYCTKVVTGIEIKFTIIVPLSYSCCKVLSWLFG